MFLTCFYECVGDVSRVKSNVPPGGLQRSKSVPQPKSKAAPTTSAGPAKQLNKGNKLKQGVCRKW